jgi:osmotically-inducible protein OsmY
VVKERVESLGEERPIPTASSESREFSSALRHNAEEAPQPAAVARAEPRRTAATAPPEPRPNLEPKPEKSRKPLLVAVAALLAVALSAAGGAYWFGYIGNRQASVQERINAELGGKGLSNVKITVAKDWKTTADGFVASQAEKDQALALVRSYGALKEITDNVRVKPTREELAQRLTKALADAGMSQVTAQLDEGLTTVTLNDATLGPEDRAKAEALVVAQAAAAAGIASIKVAHAAVAPPPPPLPAEAPPQPPAIDVAAVQRAVNDQLRKSGLESVSARVDANSKATLEGTVATSKERDRAIRIALTQQGVEAVNDSIRMLAAPAMPPPPVAKREEAPPQPATARPDPAKLEGEINRALRSGGAGGVTAEVGNDFSVTLKGSATSAAQKERAFQIARQFRNVANLKDRVFVVEQ